MRERVSYYLIRRRARAQRPLLLALGLAAIGVLGLGSAIAPRPMLIYNATASAPVGFYRVLPAGTLHRGELVLVRTPDSVRDFAARRGYLPLDVPLVKRIVALSGDRICAHHHAVSIDDRHVADQLSVDSQGRPLPRWSGCHVLTAGEVFLLMAGVRDSFDGRYFGPVPASRIIGSLVPLWH